MTNINHESFRPRFANWKNIHGYWGTTQVNNLPYRLPFVWTFHTKGTKNISCNTSFS